MFNLEPRTNQIRKRALAVIAISVVMIVAGAGTATARSDLNPDQEIPTLSLFMDPVLATLYFDVFDPTAEGDDLVDCTVAAAIADCLSIEVGEPVNHGAVVSSFVHALMENPDLWSGSKGCLVRQITQYDAGKPATDDPTVEEPGAEEPDGEDGPKPDGCAEKAEGEAARAEARAERKAGGDQSGPPPHPNGKARKI